MKFINGKFFILVRGNDANKTILINPVKIFLASKSMCGFMFAGVQTCHCEEGERDGKNLKLWDNEPDETILQLGCVEEKENSSGVKSKIASQNSKTVDF